MVVEASSLRPGGLVVVSSLCWKQTACLMARKLKDKEEARFHDNLLQGHDPQQPKDHKSHFLSMAPPWESSL